MSRIFISYKRVDIDKVFKIKDQIESVLGEKCRIDLDSIESAAFSHIILNAIEEASVVLFFYSKDTENSQWQRRELEYAKANGKTVIPIIIDEIPEDSWYMSNFGNSLVVRYADERCAELIHSKILSATKEQETHPIVGYEPGPQLKKSVSFTKRCGCGCLIGLVSLVALYLFLCVGSPAPDSAAPKPRRQSGSSVNTHQDFDKRYNTKDLALFSASELDKEFARTQIIEDSLYECIREDAAASYDLRELHRYQLYLREEQIKRSKVDSSFDNENPSDKNTLSTRMIKVVRTITKKKRTTWIWGVEILAIVALWASISHRSKKKKTRNQGKEIVPLFRNMKEIKVFIAGSTRLVSEREALRATISKMYNQHKSDNLVVEAYEFDDFPREFIEGGQQKLYDNFIRKEANWVVFITDGTIGDKTIWELENAIKVHKECGRPKILMYSVPQNITIEQKEQMSQFKSILNREDNYWIDYEDVNTIRSTFREHLEWDLINLMKQELRRVG